MGRHHVEWLFLPSVGCSGGISVFGTLIFWSLFALELSLFLCCKFKSLQENFVWGLIMVYGPNDDNVRFALFEELVTLYLSATSLGA